MSIDARSYGRRRRAAILTSTLMCVSVGAAIAAELRPETVEAYERYLAAVEQAFSRRVESNAFLERSEPSELARLRNGEVIATPGGDDAITDAPGGLIHHWRATIFISDVRLAAVMTMVQDYSGYHQVYDWMMASALLAREGNQYRSFFRLRRSAGRITGVVDLWTVTSYRSPRPDRVVSIARGECVRQVEHAGQPGERRLPAGVGNGYLWRAHTMSKYLERDGGVYVELDTIGLSRDYPPLLGWIIEPIARRLGRGSAVDSLIQLRRAVGSPLKPKVDTGPVDGGRSWCGGP